MTLSTENLFIELTQGVFGRMTIDERKFGAPFGNGLNIREGYFAERAKRQSTHPINQLVADRLTELYGAALRGLSAYDQLQISRKLVSLLGSTSGMDLRLIELTGFEEKSNAQRKIVSSLRLLNLLLDEACDKKVVSEQKIRKLFVSDISKAFEKDLASRFDTAQTEVNLRHGVLRFFFRVDDIGYRKRIETVQNRMDILHFHGLTWTNTNREFLTTCLSRQGIVVRVGLLNPASPFFEPYARFINVEPKVLKRKLAEVLEAWKTAYRDAERQEAKCASLSLHLTNGFPAKSLYRFDDIVIVTPTSNAAPKNQFMSYECQLVDRESAFGIYEREIDWLFAHSEQAWSSTTG